MKKIILLLIICIVCCGCENKHVENIETESETFTVVTKPSAIEEVSKVIRRFALYEDVDTKVVREVSLKNRAVFKKHTDMPTVHMMWRITGNDYYLQTVCDEELSDFEFVKCYWLERKNQSTSLNNYIYYIYKVTVENGGMSETGYAIFEYKDCYVDGGFVINTEGVDERYTCGDDLDKIYTDYIENKENEYNIEIINGI